MYCERKKKDPMVQKYKKVEIFLNLDTQIFYAIDEVTGETWEDERIWQIRKRIDAPLWEPCDIIMYGSQKGFDAIKKVQATRREIRTKKPEWKVVAESLAPNYVGGIGRVWEDRWGKITLYPISEHNDKMFAKVKEMSESIYEMEKLRDEIAVKSLIK